MAYYNCFDHVVFSIVKMMLTFTMFTIHYSPQLILI